MLALIFGVLSIVLIVKLNDILGRVIGFSKLNSEAAAERIEEQDVEKMEEMPSIEVKKIREYYKDFNEQVFLKTVNSVFTSVFDAYAQCDKDTLEELLSPKLYNAFKMAIDDRLSKKETLIGKVERIVSSSIDSVKIDDKKIFVDVRFTSEQTNILKNEAGNIIEGNNEFINNVQEIWTFVRSIDSNSKRWYLSEITYISEK